jgi:sigma-B regulation protein RsbU (phosphoserine phosphatase)
MPLGILPSGEFSSSEVETQPGDVFMLYTDGYVETADKSGEEFGLARLQGELQKHAREPLAVVASSLQQSVNAYGAQFDDMSILLIRHL